MDSLVSIIIPMYNVEKYIAKCITSVLNQSYTNIEIILVNDASTDCTLLVCEEYIKRDKRFKLIKNEKNSGLAYSRNAGLIIARGDYILFVDSDDWIHEDMVKTMLEIAILKNADIVLCDYIRTRSEKVEKIIPEIGTVVELSGKEAIKKIYDVKAIQPSVLYTVAWNKLYKREILGEISFPYGMLFEDQASTFQFFYNSKKVVVIKDKLYFYRNNMNSLTSKKYSSIFYGDIYAHEKQIEFFKIHDEKELKEIVVSRLMKLIVNHYYRSLNEGLKKKDLLFLKIHICKNMVDYFMATNVSMYEKLCIVLFVINVDFYSFFREVQSRRKRI